MNVCGGTSNDDIAAICVFLLWFNEQIEMLCVLLSQVKKIWVKYVEHHIEAKSVSDAEQHIWS